MNKTMDNGHCYYGIEFIEKFPEDCFLSSQLFTTREQAEKYGKWGVETDGVDGFKIHKFQLQLEHIQD